MGGGGYKGCIVLEHSEYQIRDDEILWLQMITNADYKWLQRTTDDYKGIWLQIITHNGYRWVQMIIDEENWFY